MPTPEIPREGDLKDIPEPARAELLNLRNAVQGTGGTDVSSHRDLLDAAINSGQRAEVIRALQNLQTRGEFSGLRDRIEAARSTVSTGTVTGVMDRGIVAGEQATRWTYQNLIPNWAKFGAIAGAATWAVTAPISWILNRFSATEGAGKRMADWRKTLILGVAGAAALTKAITDGVQTGVGSLAPPIARENAGFLNRTPVISSSERVTRVQQRMQTTRWVDPDGSPTVVELPDLGNTTDFPVESMTIAQFAGDRSFGSTPVSPLPSGSAAERRRSVSAETDRLVIEYRVRGVDGTVTIPPVTILKRP